MTFLFWIFDNSFFKLTRNESDVVLTCDVSSSSSIFIVTKLNMHIKIPQNPDFWIWFKCADHDKLLTLIAILAGKLQVHISIFLEPWTFLHVFLWTFNHVSITELLLLVLHYVKFNENLRVGVKLNYCFLVTSNLLLLWWIWT